MPKTKIREMLSAQKEQLRDDPAEGRSLPTAQTSPLAPTPPSSQNPALTSVASVRRTTPRSAMYQQRTPVLTSTCSNFAHDHVLLSTTPTPRTPYPCHNPPSAAFSSRASAALVALCQRTGWEPDPSEVRHWITEGANPFMGPSSDASAALRGQQAGVGRKNEASMGIGKSRSRCAEPPHSVFHLLCQHGCVEAVRACLSLSPSLARTDKTISSLRTSANACVPLLDFQQEGRWLAPLLAVGYSTKSASETAGLVQALVDRMEQFPQETLLNWWMEHPRTRSSFFHMASQMQQLSAVWPVLSRCRSFYESYPAPTSADATSAARPPSLTETSEMPLRLFSLNGAVLWSGDWEALSGPRACLNTYGAQWMHCSAATAELCRLCWQRHPELDAVQRCVAAGADLRFMDPLCRLPLLHQFIEKGSVPHVRACLATPRPVDFTVCDDCDRTPLHVMCSAGLEESDVVRLLTMVASRLDTGGSSPTGDHVDWEAEDWLGRNILSVAAEHGLLSTMYFLLKGCQHTIPTLAPYFEREGAKGTLAVRQGCCPSLPSSSSLRGGAVRKWRITRAVRLSDWEELSETDKTHFEFVEGVQAKEAASFTVHSA